MAHVLEINNVPPELLAQPGAQCVICLCGFDPMQSMQIYHPIRNTITKPVCPKCYEARVLKPNL